MARKASSIEALPLPNLDVDAFKDPAQRAAVKRLNAQLRDLHAVLDGGISFGLEFGEHAGNLDGELVFVETLTTGADFPVAHNLERVPRGVFQLVSDSESPLFRDVTTPAHTSSQLWFRSSAATGTRYWILVF